MYIWLSTAVCTQHPLTVKKTAWYRMKGTMSELLIPQAEENILEARWVKHSELTNITLKTYEAIKEVLRLAEIK